MQATRRIAAACALAALVLAGCSDDPEGGQSADETQTTAPEETTDAPVIVEVDALVSDEGMPSVVEEDGIVTLDFDGATEPDVLQVSVVEEGDGTAAISREEQQTIAADAMLAFMKAG